MIYFLQEKSIIRYAQMPVDCFRAWKIVTQICIIYFWTDWPSWTGTSKMYLYSNRNTTCQKY